MQSNGAQMHGKSKGVGVTWWFLLGIFGAHRFYYGKTGSGLAMLGLFILALLNGLTRNSPPPPFGLNLTTVGELAAVVLILWWLVDGFLIAQWTRDSQRG